MKRDYEFHLLQIADSFFPSGNFALSGGLEAMVNSSRVNSWEETKTFLKNQLHFLLRPCDCAILSMSYDAAQRSDLNGLIRIDNLFFSMRLVETVRTSSIRAGQQFLNTVLSMITMTRQPKTGLSLHESQALKLAKTFTMKIKNKEARGTLPVCLAVSTNVIGIPKRSTLRLFLYSYLVSTIGSAVRMGVVKHTMAQSIIASLRGECDSISQRVAVRKIQEVWQASPMVDILQMNHEKEEVRMFIT
jgi:urease accessory protein